MSGEMEVLEIRISKYVFSEIPFLAAWYLRRMGYTQANVRRNVEYVCSIKVELGCADCGYKAHAAALEFDHLDGTTKVRAVSWLVYHGKSIAAIDAEIAKCEVVCANCHRVRTTGRLVREGAVVG